VCAASSNEKGFYFPVLVIFVANSAFRFASLLSPVSALSTVISLDLEYGGVVWRGSVIH